MNVSGKHGCAAMMISSGATSEDGADGGGLPDPGRADDRVLLACIAAGDRAAFDAFFRRHYLKVFRFVQRLTGSADIAEELVNDTMMVVWKRAARFENRSRPSTWLIGIAYKLTIKRLDKHRREPPPVDIDNVVLEAPERPDQRTERRTEDRRLRQGLEHLPPAQRAVVELTYFHGYGYAEVARLVGCPVGTVKTRMFHARQTLRTFLAEGGVDVAAHQRTPLP